MKNILIVAPHPDDELVGTALIISRLIDKKKIIIFFPTNGVIPEDSMWFWRKSNYQLILNTRIKEMKKVIKYLGIKKYYLQNLPTRSLKSNIKKTFERIKKILILENIDTIFCPAYEGGHQDHDVCNFICSRFKYKYKIKEFAEYNFFKNKVNSNEFIQKSGKEKIFFLNQKEQKKKRELLKLYESEQKNLSYVSLEKESFRDIFDYNYSLPPHDGTLFYRRFSFFSWHPRVDSDKPEEVSSKIINSNIFNAKK